MAFSDDLRKEVQRIFADKWDTREGRVVPAPSDLSLANEAVKFDNALLSADLSEAFIVPEEITEVSSLCRRASGDW